ncbi:fructokinase-like 2, chloroplastic [Curcuma longa]|uniref:fructokinase-like 2, chloroplastic n=1 Tax=Curcuma longa TaxID=136217 RepID=UPI003D9DCB0F
MACLLSTCPRPFLRDLSDCRFILSRSSIHDITCLRLQKKGISAVSKGESQALGEEDKSITVSPRKGSKTTPRTPRRSRKKTPADNLEQNPMETFSSAVEESTTLVPSGDSKKTTRKPRKKVSQLPISQEEKTVKRAGRRSSKKTELTEVNLKEFTIHDNLTETDLPNREQQELQLADSDAEDISYTYAWPPLVCCFGAAQYAFLPSGRPANRLINHDIHESMKDMFWSPEKFFRAPGGPASSVAIALAAIGGRVAFMGKLGDDEYGQNMLYHLNINNVRTRPIKLDSSRYTAVSYMKISRRGGLKVSCSRPCAEDSFLSSDIDIDALKEAKMFYFNSSSLLDQNMRSTTLQAIKVSKKFGGVIFFDPNLPLPLWKSSEKTKAIIQEAWKHANVIELTKQELEFLCGIEPLEKFDTKDNDKSKFIHHKSETVMQLWHKDLKVLFVTNGTSKVHYYTADANGSVHGMEDAPITPFTGDMSASGDAIVAALMRMLTVQPHLITDKGYLERSIKYAINCGVTDQWLLARVRGFPPKEGMDASEYEEGRIKSITEREYRTV